jgi:cytochrome c
LHNKWYSLKSACCHADFFIEKAFMKIQGVLLFCGGLILSQATYAENAGALLNKYNCLICHHTHGKRVVGPSFEMVAKHYAGDASAADYLMQRVRAGGPGVWGSMPMPAAPAQVTDAEIKVMVAHILATQ